MKNIKIDNTVTITPEMLWEKFQEKLSAAGFDKVDNIALCQEVNAGEITAAVETTQALTWNYISRPTVWDSSMSIPAPCIGPLRSMPNALA